MSVPGYELARLRFRHDRDKRERRAATAQQELLPFEGDGSFLADEQPEFHGTTVGVGRHAAAEEPLCGPCRAWMEELVAAGLAVRLEEQ